MKSVRNDSSEVGSEKFDPTHRQRTCLPTRSALMTDQTPSEDSLPPHRPDKIPVHTSYIENANVNYAQ